MTATKAISKAKPRVLKTEADKKRSETMKRIHAEKREKKKARIKKEIPIAIPQDVPRVGNYWIWDVKYSDIGWRRMITPAPFNVFYPWRTYNVPEKLYFGDVPGATSVEVLHFHVYSLRAKAYVPVYEAIYSPWVVQQHIKPEHLMSDRGRIEEFADTQKIIAGVETQHLVAKLQNTMMLLAHRRQQVIETKADIRKQADDLAADMYEQRLLGQKPPSDLIKFFDRVKAVVSDYWYIFAIALALIAVYGFIIIRGI